MPFIILGRTDQEMKNHLGHMTIFASESNIKQIKQVTTGGVYWALIWDNQVRF
jgi:hypothetical protein